MNAPVTFEKSNTNNANNDFYIGNISFLQGVNKYFTP